MPATDTNGRAYLKLADAEVGLKIICDGGFTCMGAFETARLNKNIAGAFYFNCADGRHHIISQAEDGIHCIGIYPAAE